MTGQGGCTVPEAIETGIDFVRELVRRLEIPGLRRFGLGENQVAEMVGLARQASSMRSNPVVLSEEALADILRKAL